MQLENSIQASPHLIILGIRGIPAAHGGFETFAEKLALYLNARGWKVTVYCQGPLNGEREVDTWHGIERIHIPTRLDGAIGTIEFDIKCTIDVLKRPGLLLTLGYNTGFLSSFLASCGRVNCINMDGLEWKRAKYGIAARGYLWLNERIAAWAGTKLVADHPSIGDHLGSRVDREKIAVIPYGSDAIESADATVLAAYGLNPYRFFTVIARAEPENSILEIVRGFSAKPRGFMLVVLGQYQATHAYQKAVLDAASDEVVFPGPVYETREVQALRFYSFAYLHGHQVGGTNPSLVEALGAGNAVIAHDNEFNRWVAGDAARYFLGEAGFSAQLEAVLADSALRERLTIAARRRWSTEFTWPHILKAYESVLIDMHPTTNGFSTALRSPSKGAKVEADTGLGTAADLPESRQN